MLATPRIHGLDALRAAMMLLGLVIHAGVSYMRTRVGAEAWPYQDTQSSIVFDLLIFFIHLFRMPTFFVMSGFFAALLFYRDGPLGFLTNRVRRVLLPLAMSWVLLFPLMVAGVLFAQAGGGALGLRQAVAAVGAMPYQGAVLAHLWFLYYLFIYCLVACAAVPTISRLAASFGAAAMQRFGSTAPTFGGCLALGMVSALSMLPMSAPAIDTSLTFVPAARVLAAYGVFFVFGWLLFLRRDIVTQFARHPWQYCAAGLIASAVYLLAIVGKPFGDGLAWHVAGIVIGGVAMWLLIYGITGLFVRYFQTPSSLQRYLSDASYWMYLIHVPLVLWMLGVLAPSTLPAFAKFAIVLTTVTAVTIATYEYFVRATAIGAFLNGRRFARGLPATARADSAVAASAAL